MPSSFLSALWIVPVLGLLILVHELGHFFAARLVGITVEEFGMGLPPRLFGYRAKSGVVYSLNWIPFGGFVKMFGQDDLRPDGGAVYGEGSFVSKTPLQRAFVLVAGVLMNLLLAILIFTAIAIGQGKQGVQVYIDEVLPNSPAAAAGWQAGDRIVAVAGREVTEAAVLRRTTEDYAGRDLPVTIERNGARITTTVVPRTVMPPDEGRAGVKIEPRTVYTAIPLWEAPIQGLRASWHTFRLMYTGLWQMVSGQGNLRDVVGPVGMGQATSEIVQRSPLPLWVTLANLAALLSLNLFLLNLLPLPALDGGRLVFVVLELLRGGRKVAPEREGLVHFVGLIVLLGLMFVIGYFDIVRLVRGDSLIP